MAEKARLAHENSIYARENRFLREIVEYHQLTMQDVVYLDEGMEEVTEVYPISTSPEITKTLSNSVSPRSPTSPSSPMEVLPAVPPPPIQSKQDKDHHDKDSDEHPTSSTTFSEEEEEEEEEGTKTKPLPSTTSSS